MPKSDGPGTRTVPSQGAAGAPPPRVVAPKTIDPDGRTFVNPTGDRTRLETYAEWNLGNAVLPIPTGEQAPAPGVLERAVEDGEAQPPAVSPAESPTPPTKPKARPDEAPGSSEEEGPAGDESDNGVAKIIAKYKTMESLARGYKGLQQLQNAKDADKKRIQAELAEKLELVDEFLEKSEEGWQVRPERAVQTLQRGTPPPALIDERAIREQAAGEMRKYLTDVLNVVDEDLPDAMAKSKPMIEQRAQELVRAKQFEMRQHHDRELARAARVVEGFFSTNRELDTDEIKQKIDRWYERFPAHIRSSLILQGFLPLQEVARAAQIEANFDKAVQEAYELGKKHADIEPTTGSPTTPGTRSPIQRGVAQDDDAELKSRIRNAGVLPSIFS